MSSWIGNAAQDYVSDIDLTSAQQNYLVDQVITQLGLFYSGQDTRKMVLNAFTGSGKTTVTIKALIPAFIDNFFSQGKRIIGFTAPLKEVVVGAHAKAVEALDNTIVNGKKVRVYNQEDLKMLDKRRSRGMQSTLDGDVCFVFMTSQYMNTNFNFIASNGGFDLLIIDEAHKMFGTIDAEDTRADKGQFIHDFEPVTLNKLSLIPQAAVLFLTATPTNSQKMLTPLGMSNNVYLDPMPRSTLTTPFFDFVPYFSNQDVLIKGLDYFKKHCDSIGKTLSAIPKEVFADKEVSKNFFPCYPALMARLGRSGAVNGLDFTEYINSIRAICKLYDFRLFISRSNHKEFDGQNIGDLDEGVRIGSKKHDKPIVMVVIESGTAGVDFVKLSNVIIAREPSVPIHNNYSQTAGRAARMKFGFISHETAADTISSYKISEEHKRLLAEYYIQHSTSVVHVPSNSDVLTTDVRDFVEHGSFRGDEGRQYILDRVFGTDSHPTLITSTELVDDSYKRFKKSFCECCEVESNGRTACYNHAKFGLSKLVNVKLSGAEMDMIWPLCLQVHHLDGNHFNHDLDNLVTICPTIHAAITIQNQDYNNRYTELRNNLKK